MSPSARLHSSQLYLSYECCIKYSQARGPPIILPFKYLFLSTKVEVKRVLLRPICMYLKIPLGSDAGLLLGLLRLPFSLGLVCSPSVSCFVVPSSDPSLYLSLSPSPSALSYERLGELNVVKWLKYQKILSYRWYWQTRACRTVPAKHAR